MRSAGLAAAVMIAALATSTPGAQGRRSGAGTLTVPVTADVVLSKPEAYFGQLVTLSSGVDQILSKTAFTVDQRRVTPGSKEVIKLGRPLLVIAPTLVSPLAVNSYLTIVGEVVKFDPGEISSKAKDYHLDLLPDVVASYQGQPVLLATTVLSSTSVELTRKPSQ